MIFALLDCEVKRQFLLVNHYIKTNLSRVFVGNPPGFPTNESAKLLVYLIIMNNLLFWSNTISTKNKITKTIFFTSKMCVAIVVFGLSKRNQLFSYLLRIDNSNLIRTSNICQLQRKLGVTL